MSSFMFIFLDNKFGLKSIDNLGRSSSIMETLVDNDCWILFYLVTVTVNEYMVNGANNFALNY